jgi:hypothetical protein
MSPSTQIPERKVGLKKDNSVEIVLLWLRGDKVTMR